VDGYGKSREDCNEGYRIVNSRLEAKLYNYKSKARHRDLALMRAMLPMSPVPCSSKSHKRGLMRVEPTTYSEYIRRATTNWRTLNFGTNELKKDIMKQHKEMERARSVLSKLKRKRAFSMPNIISYGTVTTINSLMDK
jgi:hypothetical protein